MSILKFVFGQQGCQKTNDRWPPHVNTYLINYLPSHSSIILLVSHRPHNKCNSAQKPSSNTANLHKQNTQFINVMLLLPIKCVRRHERKKDETAKNPQVNSHETLADCKTTKMQLGQLSYRQSSYRIQYSGSKGSSQGCLMMFN